MEANHKILIVDSAADRKQKISALKQRGYAVFPALKLSEARSRCRPEAYDLIIISGSGQSEEAVALCEELRARTPRQEVLLMVADGGGSGPEYSVKDEAAALVTKVESLLGRPSRAFGAAVPSDLATERRPSQDPRASF